MSTFAKLLGFACLCGPVSFAGTISGKVVDSTGAPVGGVDLDAINTVTGNQATITNGHTLPDGTFVATLADGVYDIVFNPPAPPLTSHLVATLEDRVVVGTVDLGTIVLDPGVFLSGRVVNTGGAAVAGVNLDILDASGTNIPLRGDVTDVSGNFQVAAPLGAIELRLDPVAAVGPVLAPQDLELSLSSATNLGNIALAPGFLVSATVRNSGGAAVSGADADVFPAGGGHKLYTPGDNSNGAGLIDFVVPAGSYDIEWCPPFANKLAAKLSANVSVNATKNLGVITLMPGVVLSGNVKGAGGTPLQGVNVDLRTVPGGALVPTCGDKTDSSGNYQFVVPTGIFDALYLPPYEDPFSASIVTNLVISGNLVRNTTLPACPFFTLTGSGTTGLGGFQPTISATGGTPRLGNDAYRVQIAKGRGGAIAILIWSPSHVVQPLGPPTLTSLRTYTQVQLSGTPGVAGVGRASVPIPFSGNPALVGQTLRARWRVLDAAGAGGKAFSRTLTATVCP